MDHHLDLTDEAPATSETIATRWQDRDEAVSGAAQDGASTDFPSPAPASSISLENLSKPSRRRFSNKIVPTKRLHNDAGREDSARSFHQMSDALTPQPAGDRKEQ